MDLGIRRRILMRLGNEMVYKRRRRMIRVSHNKSQCLVVPFDLQDRPSNTNTHKYRHHFKISPPPSTITHLPRPAPVSTSEQTPDTTSHTANASLLPSSDASPEPS